jgi:hypothetical protein
MHLDDERRMRHFKRAHDHRHLLTEIVVQSANDAAVVVHVEQLLVEMSCSFYRDLTMKPEAWTLKQLRAALAVRDAAIRKAHAERRSVRRALQAERDELYAALAMQERCCF